MILALEELSMNALPALRTYLLDGWILRFANGYTRRANSVNPLYPGTFAVEGKIETCEKLYRAANLPINFKMITASEPPDLDAALEARGYRREPPTSVQTCALKPGAPPVDRGVSMADALTAEWCDAYCRMNNVPLQHQATLQQILGLIVPRRIHAMLLMDGVPVACGLGVLDQNALGLFDIVVDPAWRRRGYGTRLVRALLDWGIRNGAGLAYLQVVLNNEPALNLYARLGFGEHHRYWYRTLA